MRLKPCSASKALLNKYFMGPAFAAGLLVGFAQMASAQPASSAGSVPDSTLFADLSRMSIDELAELSITSVLRRPTPISESPASIYVITADDIRRSGAHTLPEVLRLAPSLDVAALDALTHAVSARGFGGFVAAANKLLVLVDGRTVYSPLFAGVFWDAQNFVLADIERIEVISGPGGTLWGVNAVNGVINIITKDASETQGVLAEAGIGSLDQDVALRIGGKLGEHAAFRVYGLGMRRGESLRQNGTNAGDEWSGLQFGMRFDWQYANDAITVQGDVYNNTSERGNHNQGHNMLARWTRRFDGGSTLDTQIYYDKVPRGGNGARYATETLDAEFKHTVPLGEHVLVWGGGLRHIDDYFQPLVAAPFTLLPASKQVQLGNIFIQDSIPIGESVTFTLGSKFEYSGYTGLEFLPSARLGWTVTGTDFLWAALSRAVRSPSRLDRDIRIAPFLFGGPNFEAENVIAYEAGYRGRIGRDISLSASVFYNDYDNLRTIELTNGGLPAVIENGVEGTNYGIETWASYHVFPWWRLSAGLAALAVDFRVKPGRIDFTRVETPGNNPELRATLRTQMDLTDAVHLDIGLRAVDDRSFRPVPGYVEADVNLAWRASENFILSLVGSNLLNDSHPEGVNDGARNEIRRSVYLKARWTN